MHDPGGHGRQLWVLAGGCVLAMLAAAVNVDFMLRLGVSVSHLTGDLSRITMESVRAGGHWSPQAAVLCVSLVGFVGGAATSGFFIHHPTVEIGRPYGRSLTAIGLLLMLSHALNGRAVPLVCLPAAWACGMQNALATRYRGLVLRTTHVTGLLTDLGQLIGMRMRGHEIEKWKIGTPLVLFAGFASGAALGAVGHLRWHWSITLVCGSCYVVGGLGWSAFKRRFLK